MITVLTGDNDYAIARFLTRLRADFAGEPEYYDGADLEPVQLPDICAGMTLFSSERMIVISGASVNKTLWAALEQWVDRIPDSTHLVLAEPRLDKRTKTYKMLVQYADVREHRLLDEPALVSWLQVSARGGGIDLAVSDAKYLVSYCGYDQWRLKSELDKLLLSQRPIDRESIRTLCEPHTEASAFELLDNIFNGRNDRAEELLVLLAEREDPYKFLGLLSTQLLALLVLVSAGQRSVSEVAKDTGVHPFVLQKLRSVAKKLGKPGVTRAIDRLARCDTRIKTSGAEPWGQLRHTLLTMSV